MKSFPDRTGLFVMGVFLVCLLCVLTCGTAIAGRGVTALASVDNTGNQGTADSFGPSISADGRYVAFYTDASNLVPDDINFVWDVFVHDRLAGETTRVSVDGTGAEGNDASRAPSISGDGRYVAFASRATNLVPGGTNGFQHIFVHDRQTGQNILVSVNDAGVQGNSDSSPFDIDSPSISADARYVAFTSDASNLVSGDNFGLWDVFVRDTCIGATECFPTTRRVSVDDDGIQGNGNSYFPSISADGRHIAFTSEATNLVAPDTNNFTDVFVHDLVTLSTTRVSVGSDGSQGNDESAAASISADGRYIAFQSISTNLVQEGTNGTFHVFLRDRQENQTSLVSTDSNGNQGNLDSYVPSISGDGRYVAFLSAATNLVSGDTNDSLDVFLRDRLTGQTTRLSVSSAGAQAEGGDSQFPSISKDGRKISFESRAVNLVADDTNGANDIFARQLTAVPNDFEGDSRSDPAVYRPSSGVWYLLQSSDGYDQSMYKAYLWGNATDVPVPGDYDGDGRTDIAVRRPSSGTWYILQSSDGYDQSKYRQYAWGNESDNVVSGDFDGDGKADIAVFRPSDGVWYILQSSDGYDPGKYKAYLWGGDPNDIPVPGDYDGDGKTDVAVYRPSEGVWYILQSSDGYDRSQYKAYLWGGGPNDIPIPGDYDLDGKADITVYRPSEGVWYILRSTDGYDWALYEAYLWGESGDMPVLSFH